MKMLAVQTTCRYPTVVLHRKLGCLSKLQQSKRTKYWHKQYVSDSGPLEGAGEADANTEVNENSEDTGFQNSGKNDPHTHTQSQKLGAYLRDSELCTYSTKKTKNEKERRTACNTMCKPKFSSKNSFRYENTHSNRRSVPRPRTEKALSLPMTSRCDRTLEQ